MFLVAAEAVACTLASSAVLTLPDLKTQVEDYIRTNMPLTVRSNVYNEATLIPVPNPYTVGCISGMFREIYYWGVYFNNQVLFRLGSLGQARMNVENVAYFVDWFGFMPNGNRMHYLTRSQPPFFTFMVKDVYERTKDKDWLGRMYALGCREWSFWQEKRMTPSGLNRYYGRFPNAESRCHSGRAFCKRLQMSAPEDDEELQRYGDCFMAYCESGWDCCSRFRGDAQDGNWLCLNCLLYGEEMDLAMFAEILGNGEAGLWRARADRRRKLMNELMWDEERGMFCDYNFVRKEKSDFVSVAAFYPLYVGLATPEQAKRTLALLPKLECEYGIASSENRNLQNLQWDYPHGWPPLQQIMTIGLARYGYGAEAHRVATKYCRLVEKVYAETGRLWEKYNVVTGSVSVNKEYETPPIFGWTAGAYLYCREVVLAGGNKEAGQ